MQLTMVNMNNQNYYQNRIQHFKQIVINMKVKKCQPTKLPYASSKLQNYASFFIKQSRIRPLDNTQQSSTVRSPASNQLEGRREGQNSLYCLNVSSLFKNGRQLHEKLLFFLFLIVKIKILLHKYLYPQIRRTFKNQNYLRNPSCFSPLLRITLLLFLIYTSNGTHCSDGQVWDSVNNNCALCLDSNCKICTAPFSVNVCQTCNDGYVITNLTCQLCSAPFCQSCIADMSGIITCSTCVTGYTIGGSGCQTCATSVPHCLECTSPTSCLTCQSGFVQGAACDPCQSFLVGCTQCSDNSTCTECNTVGYFLEPGQTTCSLCNSKPSLSFCIECESTGLYCITCDTNFMLGVGNVCDQCGNVVPHCMTCVTGACTSCDPGFMLSGGSCLPCSSITPNCSTCTSAACSTCTNEFFLNSTVCSPCAAAINNCTICSDSLVCSNCISDNVVVVNGSSTTCQHCSLVMLGCQSCRVINQCDTCDYASGYFLNSSGLCDLCSPTLLFCAYCTNSTTCTLCSSSLYGVNSLSQCQSCQALATGCLTCLNSTYCASCISNQFYLNLTDSTCYYCNHFLPYCKQCIQMGGPPLKCSKCNLGFHLNYNLECMCDVGTLIDGYCVDVVGCIHASFGPKCTACQSGMILSNEKCVCPPGEWMVTEHCTNVAGCIAVKQSTPLNLCLFCDLQQHFLLGNDSQCHCSEQYRMASNICIEICGDGVVINAECDDGNQVDGDGCASNCKAQTDYACSIANKTSKCLYTSKFTITLVKIEKIENVNSGRFIFEFSPNVNALSAMNYSKYLKLSIPNSNYTISSIIYSNGYLYVNFDYQSDLQGLLANLTLEFDPDFFSVSAYSHIFPIVSDGLQFRYLIKLQFYRILNYVFMGLGLLALLIFVVSLPLHKMLGVETLQTFQLFFIIALIIDYYQEPLNALTYLKNTIGMVALWAYNTSVALNAKLLYNRLGVLKQFLQNQIFVCPLSILLVIIFLSYFLRYLFQSNQQEKYTSTFLKKLIRVCSCIYKCLLFPIVIGFSFGSFIALYSETSTQKEWKNPNIKNEGLLPQRANFIFIFMFCLFYSFVFWAEVLIPKRSRVAKDLLNVQKSKSWYVSQYLAYSFLLLCFFMGGYQVSLKASLNMIFVAVCVHFCLVLFSRPYKEKIHFAGIILNQSSLFILCLCLIIRYLRIKEGHSYTQQDNILMVLLFAFLLTLVNVMAIIRIVFVAYLKLRNQPTLKKGVDQDNFKQKMLQIYLRQTQQRMQGNRYLIDNQIISGMQSQWREKQLTRIQYGVEQLQFSRSKFEKHLLKAMLKK